MAEAAEDLRRAAEREMRRTLPDDIDGRPAKKPRGHGGQEEYTEVGRFDYSAVEELADSGGGVSGFLVTCSFRNEKTATKEANKLLCQYLSRHQPAASRPTNEQPEAAAADREGAGASPEQEADSRPLLSIVKLGCRGVVMLKLNGAAAMATAPAPAPGAAAGASGADPAPAAAPGDAGLAAALLVHRVAGELLADVDSGRVRRLQHCQRIMPVHSTCRLAPEELQRAAARLAAVAVAASSASGRPGAAAEGAAEPSRGDAAGGAQGAAAGGAVAAAPDVRFGVAYKPRGANEAAPKTATAPAAGEGAAGSNEPAQEHTDGAQPKDPAAERLEMIRAVAGGFESAMRDRHGRQAKVDLRAPDWVLLVEVLPVMGASFAALCALPAALCALKPKMHMRLVGQSR